MTSANICEAESGAIPAADVPAGHGARGDLLGDRYRLEELVGQGGMGRVYRATDEFLGRTVAIKLFPAAAADQVDRARRDSETRLLASLSHPSLVTLYDADTLADGSGYLVLEYVDGGTLADTIARGPMAPHHVGNIAVDLAEGLDAVHAAGVIHRDIKPPNVLLRSAHGRPFQAMLADFGIAYLIDAARMTTPGMAVGTAAYFSPEQARGAQPSPASDIYALGLVLIEALTGRRAFPQTTPIEAAIARLHTMPEVPAGFGYGWRSLLTAMTASDPAARPTALQVAERARALIHADAAVVEADVTAQAAVPVAAAPTAAAPTVAEPAVARVEDVTTRPLRVEAVRSRDRRRRRARRTMLSRLALAGAGVAVIGLGHWGVSTMLEPSTTHVRQLETPERATVVDEAAETTAPASVTTGVETTAPAAVTTVAEDSVAVEGPAPQTAGQQQPAAPKGAAEDQGPNGSAQGNVPAHAGSGDKTHGNGNGNGRSGVGTSGNGNGG